MSDLEFIIYTMMAMGFMLGIAIGYLYFNTFRWVQMKRQITRQNHGIIYFMSRGKALYPKVVNFGNDIMRTHKGLWVLYEGAIYRQVVKEENQASEMVEDPMFQEKTEEMSIGEKRGRFGMFQKSQQKIKVKLHKKITGQDIEYRQGVPIMFLDIEDMIPLRLQSEKMDLPIVRNPYMIEAVLGKEVAAAELEALKMTKKTMKTLILIVAVLVVVGIALSALNYFDQQRIGAMVFQINQTLSAGG